LLEFAANRGDLHIGEHSEHPSHLNGCRLVVSGDTQAVCPERGDAKEHQAVVATEEDHVIGAPHIVVIVPGPGGRDVCDIDEAERRRVFEQEAEKVPTLEVARPTLVAEAPVLWIADVEIPWVARDAERMARSLHEAFELICCHPPLHRTLAQRERDRLAAR
jgi:hypothetical protein